MDKFKMLSGEELLDKGITKLEVTLPVLDLKDNTPDGSWLEQKQIQSALEARKHLIEAQRIDKRGVLTHAVWHEDLKLAEVTQLTGSHWQFFGHVRDKKVYLRPEEILYMMEVNCLLLRFKEIVVSLQQAYSLLLPDETSRNKYKVYGFLSRLGYKVFPHDSSIGTKDDEKVDSNIEIDSNVNKSPVEENIDIVEEQKIYSSRDESTKDGGRLNKPNGDQGRKIGTCNNELTTKQNNNKDNDITLLNNGIHTIVEISDEFKVDGDNHDIEMEIQNDSQKKLGSTNQGNSSNGSKDVREIGEYNYNCNIKNYKDPLTKFIEWKLEKLKDRQFKMRPVSDNHNHFENIPDLSENRVVTVKVPKENLIPKNIFLNNLTYVLNLDNLAAKNAVSCTGSNYSISDEVNGDHVRRVTSTSQNGPLNVHIPPFYQHRQTAGYRPYQHWRPRPNLSYFHFNLYFQRPYMTNFNMPRFHFYPRTHFPMFPRFFTSPTNSSVNINSDALHRENETNLKRKRNNARKLHLESIKDLTKRLRHLVASGNVQTQNLEALQRLIQTYNIRYRTKVRLTDQYEIINEETIVETIELDDDDKTKNKKRRVDSNRSLQDVHLDKIRQIAFKLKQLEAEKKASARHRRALSSLIKTYNKSYNADVYVSDNNEILDRQSITLDSSSDTESVVEQIPKIKSGKKLRNPFNILKRLSEKQNIATSSTTSRQDCTDENVNESDKMEISENVLLDSVFGEGWLPNPNDFGRPELLNRDNMNIRIIESKKEEYLYEFLKDKPIEYNNWIETKIAFLENIEETNAIFQSDEMKVDSADIKSIIKSEDCTDMPFVLKKLSIIKSNNVTVDDLNLAVDFDVYNRDVQNFRKTSRPTPHFRIVCLNDSIPCPSGIEIASLHAKYKDDVMIVFAIVGPSSISFIQMTPTVSPIYNSAKD